ncbi:jg22465 [Pararge aegeria aegeria]|uniref:Jg22465 protein n=1 Tax=Pararge aegeria aegeria TaxID=348720 RepID=A0A8S4SBD1_9NEOP|nr:jg22465 [Pararge aegeria aegeria]
MNGPSLEEKETKNRRSSSDINEEISRQFGQGKELMVGRISMNEYKILYAGVEKNLREALKWKWHTGFGISNRPKPRKLRQKRISRSGDSEDVDHRTTMENKKDSSLVRFSRDKDDMEGRNIKDVYKTVVKSVVKYVLREAAKSGVELQMSSH